MKIVEIRNAEALAGLRPEWNALLGESAARVIFLTPEWVCAWWAAYGTAGELRVLAVYDDRSILRGLALLRAKPVRRYGQTVPALQFIGYADDECDSDYLDFVIASGWESEVLDGIYRHLAPEIRRGAVLLLNEIPSASLNLPVLAGLAQSRDLRLSETDVPCGTVALPASWDEYLQLLKPRFRTKVRSVLRNLEARGEAKFGFCKSAEELDRLLPVLFDLHERRWRAEGKPGVFRGKAKRNFYHLLSASLLEKGWLRFSWLEWNGRILACQYGFAYDGVYSQLQEGYEPDAEHWNVGAALRAWSIREYIREGLHEYDFLGGMGRHKADWGAREKLSKRLMIAAPGPGNALFVHGPECERAVRDSVRALVPESILSQRRRVDIGSSAGWARRAAAKFYVHSGAPAIVRAVRDRYEVAVRPGVSLRKRVESGGRIFYYHRVNDDRDPFFTATPTAVFDAHMRYLARHYTVVSLPELRRRLDHGDSAELVVAVTFDDGYRDNYEVAYPILKRYGLPATIFLTTGSLDSGEPLWFEQLAEALKRTTREYVDLEFDIPRRFWLRTEAERLRANDRLCEMVRALSDVERRARLADILDRVGAPEQWDRNGKMLTWDQVRAMKADRIDFGGHTVTHPYLSKVSPEDAAWEVSECKRRIEAETQSEVECFAYPSGREQDFCPSNKEILRAAGYRSAVTTLWGMNYRDTDPMELRRGGPWEENPDLFAMKLDWYQFTNE